MKSYREENIETESAVRKTLPLEYFSREKKVFNEIREQKALQGTIKEGDRIPPSLPNTINGEPVSVESLTGDNRYLIISYQRGEWCPFCNLELKHLQKRINDYHNHSATVVSMSPRPQQKMQSVIDKYGLTFDMLYDKDMDYAEELGIVFELPDFMVSVYHNLGMDASYRNDNGRYQVPAPATFIVSKEGVILKQFIELNYMRRLDPDKIFTYLKSLD